MATQDPTHLARELADLARLELGDHEASTFGDQLASILSYIRKLQSVDVEGVPEYLSVEREASGLRDDSVGPMLAVDDALAGVPVHRGRMVVVPKFKED